MPVIRDPEDFPDDEILARMTIEEQVKHLKEWFFTNFEDPANQTPYESAEGGYQYIWGGPYQAQDELYDRFGPTISAEAIDAAIADIESDGWEWAPTDISDQIDDDFADRSAWEAAVRTAREDLGAALDDLERALEQISSESPGLGHNNPPEPIDEVFWAADENDGLRAVLGRGRRLAGEEHELQSASARKRAAEELEQLKAPLEDKERRSRDWLARKLDIATDAAASQFGKRAGDILYAGAISGGTLVVYHAWEALGHLLVTITTLTKLLLLFL